MKSQKLWHALLCSGFVVAFFFSPQKTLAASFTLQSSQTTLNPSDEYTVTATLSIGSANGTMYYLRGAFYLAGTTNYCGYTYNGSTYYNGPYTTNNGWANLLPITVQNSSWSGTLKAKLDTSDSGCSSSGPYNFKIERFTISGTGTFDAQNEQTLTVAVPTPTPTPVPISTPIPATNTSVPTATPKPSSTPTQKPSATTKPTIASMSGDFATTPGVLGGSDSARPTLIKGMQDKKKIETNYFAIFLILGGVIILSGCGILLFYNYKKGKTINETTDE